MRKMGSVLLLIFFCSLALAQEHRAHTAAAAKPATLMTGVGTCITRFRPRTRRHNSSSISPRLIYAFNYDEPPAHSGERRNSIQLASPGASPPQSG